MPLIMRSTAAFCRFIELFGSIRSFSEGTWSTRGWRCPIGASGTEFIDGAAAGSREPADCAIAAEVSTMASNATVAINFRIMGLPGWGPPPDHGEENLDLKVRQTSRFVQMAERAGRRMHCDRDNTNHTAAERHGEETSVLHVSLM
jgi:hypothetical protein